MAYTIVAICVLLLKYEVESEGIEDARVGFFSKLFNADRLSTPTRFTSGLVTILVCFYVLVCACMCLVISLMGRKILDGDVLSIVLLTCSIIAIVFLAAILSHQPKSEKVLTFSVPCTPWFPALSIMINIYLLAQLGIEAWIRFCVWMVIGLLIYIFYGRRFSHMKDEDLIINNDGSESSIDTEFEWLKV